ncbi:MAG TPA: trehalose-6-phosphate synthase, partial [Arthrobacter sp.]|nr:trehalose-6-phosphate synthase [Arthrobacter sp.]
MQETASEKIETTPENRPWAEAKKFDFMVVSNRLPVDRCSSDDAENDDDGWRRSPGGLVTALAPLMMKADGAWVGWHGA